MVSSIDALIAPTRRQYRRLLRQGRTDVVAMQALRPHLL